MLQEVLRSLRLADREADLAPDVDGAGERAQVEADDGLLEPFTGGGDDAFRGGGLLHGGFSSRPSYPERA